MQDFDELLDQVEQLLKQRQRLSYSGLEQRFGLDKAAVAAVCDELIHARQVATDEGQKVLVWQPKEAGVRRPVDYTPRHLANKILTRRQQHRR